MTFLYPLGLLGLIGIPILILIYIIKSKYTEQTIASTYLWTLSERFLKKRNPISKLTGIISLILQILAVLLISLSIAHPIFTLPGAAKEYCFVLDASGSMNMEQDGKSRFALGKERIEALIDEAVDGSRFSLVCVGDTTSVVFEGLEDKDRAYAMLEELHASHTASDFTDAIGVAQGYFTETPSTQTYLVTDKSYEINNNLQLINVAEAAENYAVSTVDHSLVNGTLTVTGTVISYTNTGTLTMELYLEDATQPVATAITVAMPQQPTAFQLSCACEGFTSFKVRIVEQDAMTLDNEVVVFNPEGERFYQTLLVSETPFFLESALRAVSNANIEVLSPEEYTGQSGYGLYIFDGVTPEALPRDGAVWMINVDGSVENAGFSVQGEVELESAEALLGATSSSSIAKNLTADLLGNDIYITKYIKYGLYRNFTTLFSYKGNPIIFAGTNTYGNRQVVLAFSLHDSNLPLLMDYVVLIRNMFEFSFPDVLERVLLHSGESLEINLLSNCESVRVDSPSGEVTYLDTTSAISQYTLTEVGTHTITMMVSGSERQFYVYSALPEEERVPVVTETELSLQGEASGQGFDGKYDSLMILVILLAVIFLADWVVYCYEKYQLR